MKNKYKKAIKVGILVGIFLLVLIFSDYHRSGKFLWAGGFFIIFILSFVLLYFLLIKIVYRFKAKESANPFLIALGILISAAYGLIGALLLLSRGMEGQRGSFDVLFDPSIFISMIFFVPSILITRSIAITSVVTIIPVIFIFGVFGFGLIYFLIFLLRDKKSKKEE